jgi:glycosyltransferase involved in cell wall biosynthesis
MKIAYIAGGKIPSQSANSIQVMKMCEAISSLGHNLTLFIRNLRYENKPNEDIRAFYNVKEAFNIERTLFEGIVAHSISSSFAIRLKSYEICYTRSVSAAFATSYLGIPTVFEIHRPFESAFGAMIAPHILNSPKVITVAISHSLREYCIEHYRVSNPQRIIAVHDGVDLDAFCPLPPKEEIRRDLGIPQDKKVICYAGSLYKGRGVETLISAARSLRGDMMLLIVGGRREDLVRLVGRAGNPPGNVRIEGYVPHGVVPKYLKAADVLVMPYERGAQDVRGSLIAEFMSPLKMFEYMASGTPIVSSDLKVIREVLRDGENAVLFRAGDGKAMLDAIMLLATDSALASRIGEKAMADARGYTWQERARSILGKVQL